MKVTITTGEQKKGFLGGTTVYELHCKIDLTSSEALTLPTSGNPTTQLTDCYAEEDEAKYNYIRLSNAIGSSGTTCWVRSVGQLKAEEDKIIARCQEIQGLLDLLDGYKVNKTYTVDITEPR